MKTFLIFRYRVVHICIPKTLAGGWWGGGRAHIRVVLIVDVYLYFMMVRRFDSSRPGFYLFVFRPISSPIYNPNPNLEGKFWKVSVASEKDSFGSFLSGCIVFLALGSRAPSFAALE